MTAETERAAGDGTELPPSNDDEPTQSSHGIITTTTTTAVATSASPPAPASPSPLLRAVLLSTADPVATSHHTDGNHAPAREVVGERKQCEAMCEHQSMEDQVVDAGSALMDHSESMAECESRIEEPVHHPSPRSQHTERVEKDTPGKQANCLQDSTINPDYLPPADIAEPRCITPETSAVMADDSSPLTTPPSNQSDSDVGQNPIQKTRGSPMSGVERLGFETSERLAVHANQKLVVTGNPDKSCEPSLGNSVISPRPENQESSQKGGDSIGVPASYPTVDTKTSEAQPFQGTEATSGTHAETGENSTSIASPSKEHRSSRSAAARKRNNRWSREEEDVLDAGIRLHGTNVVKLEAFMDGSRDKMQIRNKLTYRARRQTAQVSPPDVKGTKVFDAPREPEAREVSQSDHKSEKPSRRSRQRKNKAPPSNSESVAQEAKAAHPKAKRRRVRGRAYQLSSSSSSDGGVDIFIKDRSEYSSSRLRARRSVPARAHGMDYVDREEEEDPLTLLSCEEYTEESQPFHLLVRTNVLLVMDLHAHLRVTEIIGFLVGLCSFENDGVGGDGKPVLEITRAHPCRSVAEPGFNEHMNVEMDPMSEVEVRESLGEGERVVGWYHSHPTFPANPSLVDVENQQNYQGLFADESPFVGAIVGPYDPKSRGCLSIINWFHVSDETRLCVTQSIPDRSIETECLVNLLREYASDPMRIDFEAKWKRKHTKREKLLNSLRSRMPWMNEKEGTVDEVAVETRVETRTKSDPKGMDKTDEGVSSGGEREDMAGTESGERPTPCESAQGCNGGNETECDKQEKQQKREGQEQRSDHYRILDMLSDELLKWDLQASGAEGDDETPTLALSSPLGGREASKVDTKGGDEAVEPAAGDRKDGRSAMLSGPISPLPGPSSGTPQHEGGNEVMAV